MAVFSRFLTFFGAVFFIMTHIYRQTKYILQKNCPQMSFPGCRKAPKILLPLLKGSHCLLNWQIQITRVSWVGQSTRFASTCWFLIPLFIFPGWQFFCKQQPNNPTNKVVIWFPLRLLIWRNLLSNQRLLALHAVILLSVFVIFLTWLMSVDG